MDDFGVLSAYVVVAVYDLDLPEVPTGFLMSVAAGVVAAAIFAVLTRAAIIILSRRIWAAIAEHWQRTREKRQQAREQAREALYAVATEDMLAGIPERILRFLAANLEISHVRATDSIMLQHKHLSRRVAEQRARRAVTTAIKICGKQYRTSTRRGKFRMVLRPAQYYWHFFLPAGVEACLLVHFAPERAQLRTKATLGDR